MEDMYWHKQTFKSPLYEDLLWSRPENKLHAGKLLIIGGNANGFSAPAVAFQTANKAGVGACRVILPNSLQKIVGKHIGIDAIFSPSNRSGSFAQQSIDEFLLQSEWADAVFLAGDFGRNSETAIALEKFVAHFKKPLVATQDAAEYFISNSSTILQRHNILLVINFAQLRKLAITAKFEHTFTFNLSSLLFIEMLHQFSEKYSIQLIVQRHDTIYVASEGLISSTKFKEEISNNWNIQSASHSAVWWMQNPTIPFKALTTSVIASDQKSL